MFVISFGLSRTMEFFQVGKLNYPLTEFANLAFDMALVFRSVLNLIAKLYQLRSLINLKINLIWYLRNALYDAIVIYIVILN